MRTREIAVVDDTEPVRNLLARIVERTPESGLAWAAATGQEAIELAEARPPDLIIVDLFLPDMPGHEIVKAIRKNRTPQQTRILILTGMLDERRRRQAEEAGADKCLQKGDSLEELKATIHRLATL